MREPTKICHLFTHFYSLGGVQSVLQGHHDRDRELGFSSQFFSYFESEPATKDPRVACLGLTGSRNIRDLRGRFQARAGGSNESIAFYLNFWGLPLLCDLDGCRRRVGVLHSDWPGVERWLRAQLGLVDGVVCVSPSLAELCRSELKYLDPGRVASLPCPIKSAPVNLLNEKAFRKDGALHIGFCGRIGREQKRADLLPRFARRLEEQGVSYRLDVVGEGPLRKPLAKEFESNPNVRILGRQSGKDYWDLLRQWDAIVFLSEFEGIPLVLLEAFTAGVLPIYPRIQGGGAAYVEQIEPSLIFPKGDLGGAVQCLKRLCGWRSEQIDRLRERGLAAARPHASHDYYPRFAEFARFISNEPRVSRSHFPKRPMYWTDLLPFGVLRRLGHWPLLRIAGEGSLNVEY